MYFMDFKSLLVIMSSDFVDRPRCNMYRYAMDLVSQVCPQPYPTIQNLPLTPTSTMVSLQPSKAHACHPDLKFGNDITLYMLQL